MSDEVSGRAWLIALCVASVVAGLIPYMQIPYAKLALPNALIGIWILVPVAGALLVRGLTEESFSQVMLSAALPFPAVVMIRIVYDVAAAGDSHNLWPFELIIAAILGAIVGAVGAGLGNLVRKAAG